MPIARGRGDNLPAATIPSASAVEARQKAAPGSRWKIMFGPALSKAAVSDRQVILQRAKPGAFPGLQRQGRHGLIHVDQRQHMVQPLGGIAPQRIDRRIIAAQAGQDRAVEKAGMSPPGAGRVGPTRRSRLSGLPQDRPRPEWTLIFSAASHSTPQVKPKPPLTLVRAQKRLRISDQARPSAARRLLSCVSL